ncbi:MAG: ankyrin repeat domain-containing protein [Flavobacterium sp.]
MSEENKLLAETILHGKIEEARTLLKDGSTLSGPYFENNKAQIFSSLLRSKAFDLIDILVENGVIETDIYEYDSFDKSFFKSISTDLKGDEESIRFLKNFMQKTQNKNDEVRDLTLLGYFFQQSADPDIVKCLIEEGCDVRYKTNAERNFLYEVTNTKMQPVEKTLAYLELLISEGLDVNEKDIIGETPLMAAVKDRKKECMELLLQNGADANEQDKKGNTAFYFAVNWQQDFQLYKILKEYASPDFELENKDGERILPAYIKGIGTSESQIAFLLEMLADGGDIYQTGLYYSVPKSGADWLAEKPAAVLKAVLENGNIEVDRKDDSGNTLLHKVCAYNVNYDAEAAKNIYQKVKLLLAAGADPGVTNDKDETPLTFAQQDNLKIKTVELLMQQKV